MSDQETEVFACEGCGASAQLSALDSNGRCATCVDPVASCPFDCAGTDREVCRDRIAGVPYAYVRCDCGATGPAVPQTPHADIEADAIAAWNSRR